MNDGITYIVQGLRPLAVRCDTLVPDPKNARDHDERNLDTIRASLVRFGQRQPIVVQRQGMRVRAGNGRLKVARQLGWDFIAAVVVDESDAEAAAYAIVDNRSAELASWNLENVAETLAELQIDLPSFDIEDLGWNETELAGLEMASAWDDMEMDRDALRGTRNNIDRSTLVLRFNSTQAIDLQTRVQAAGLGDTVTPESMLQLVTKCR